MIYSHPYPLLTVFLTHFSHFCLVVLGGGLDTDIAIFWFHFGSWYILHPLLTYLQCFCLLKTWWNLLYCCHYFCRMADIFFFLFGVLGAEPLISTLSVFCPLRWLPASLHSTFGDYFFFSIITWNYNCRQVGTIKVVFWNDQFSTVKSTRLC